MLALMNTNDPVKLQEVFMQYESMKRCSTERATKKPFSGNNKRLTVQPRTTIPAIDLIDLI